MGLFNFEESLSEAYDSIEEKGVSTYYADIYDVNENIVCIQTPDGKIYDKNNYILEEQYRYKYMIEIGALKQVRTEIYEGKAYKVNPWGIIEEGNIEDRIKINGYSVNIEYHPPKGYVAVGKSKDIRNEISRRYFNTPEEAIEHAELELEDF